MNGELDGQTMPVDLHFNDERTFPFDIDSVIRDGRRIRRRRRILEATVSAVTVGALGVIITTFIPGPQAASLVPAAESPINAFEQSSIVEEYPPAGGHVTLLATRVGQGGADLSVLGWISGKTVCVGAGNLSTNNASGTTVGCGYTPIGFDQGNEPAILSEGFSPHTDLAGNVPYIGLVHGDILSVSLTFKGHKYTAKVTPLPGVPLMGAYVVWIPWTTVSVSDKDISNFTAVGSAGQIVAVRMY